MLFLFFAVDFILAEENKCTTAESNPGQKRLCFFALNGPDESTRVKQENPEGLNCIKPSDGSKIRCSSDPAAEDGDSSDGGEESSDEAVNLEIKEFYADSDDNQSVSQAFEEMTKTRCDGLVISGHHVGYYTGGKTSQEKDTRGNRDVDQVTLNLKFLEKLSCLQSDGGDGSGDCKKWFSNIKYVHLHGSHTSGDKVLETENARAAENEEIKTVDDLALSRMNKYKPEGWTRASAQYLNREYASTVDENNSLSSRYLKMFPSAQIYSWAVAPTIDQGSPETFIENLKMITAHAGIAGDAPDATVEESPEVLENILNILSPVSELEPKCFKLTEWDSQGKEINAISESDKQKEEGKREIGCNLSAAIESGNKAEIIEALEDVQEAGALHQNLNRIFYALNNDSSLSAEVKQAIRQKLKNSGPFREALEGQVKNNKVGVVKRADALYLYKQIYPESYQSGDFENQFIGDLTSLYEQQEEGTVGTAMKGMIAELIWKNNLGSSEVSRDNLTKLVGLLEEEKDIRLSQHAELMKISSGLYAADSNISNANEIFERLFGMDEADGGEFRDSQYFIKMWTYLQNQNQGDFAPIQAMYDSALAAIQNESDESKKEKLIRKFSDVVFGISSGFTVRKEDCLKDEFPLGDRLTIAEVSRQNMKDDWNNLCDK